MRAPPAVHGVLETCLYVDDLETARRFYEEVLGLEPFAREPGRHAFFRCGAAVFLLFIAERTQEAEGTGPPAHGAHGPGHVCFAVPEAGLDAWREHLIMEGIAIEREIAWPRGGRSLYMRDPSGNSIELASPRIWGFADSAMP